MDACPCGKPIPESQCCGRYLAGEAAPTAEALMRSRYTAYVHCDVDYLMATNSAKTRGKLNREAIELWAKESKWLGLTVLDVVDGGEGDEEGEVEFAARFEADGKEHTHRERSIFEREDGAWVFVGGAPPKGKPERREERPSPNAQCPCGSGKKYKRCCGRS
ncbi:MAG TPA: YchJ family metal-binding protein [Myxococcales bacterium]|jgi:SEC-C motif-containing protein